MDIRTKLVFALVAVSLGSMLVLGAMAYTTARDQLRENTLRQLDALAESKKQDLEKVIAGWRDLVRLIASRTQLRLSLRDHSQTGEPEHRGRIRRILADARRSVAAVELLAVYDVEGRAVASAGRTAERELPELAPSRLPAPGETVVYEDVSFAAENEPRVSFVASLDLAGERIGALYVVLNATELIDLTQNFTGLGKTGETMVVLRVEEGFIRILHPVRHWVAERPGSVRPEDATDPASRALREEERIFAEGVVDYRGQPVWAATRYLPETNWGLVVKFDAAEEQEPIVQFGRKLLQLALTLSAFAIVLGTFLGLRFAKPIHDLAAVANRIRLGDLSARAQPKREDEIGFLAQTFNETAEELERQMALLHDFQKFFDVSLDMLCIAGTDGHFKRINPAFERTLGWRTEELLARPFIEFVHPDDVEPTVREVEKLAQGIPTVSFENRYRCADGSYRHLLWTSHPEPQTGLLYAVARDITDLKQLQEQFRASDAEVSQAQERAPGEADAGPERDDPASA